jgi:hypothetical protein
MKSQELYNTSFVGSSNSSFGSSSNQKLILGFGSIFSSESNSNPNFDFELLFQILKPNVQVPSNWPQNPIHNDVYNPQKVKPIRHQHFLLQISTKWQQTKWRCELQTRKFLEINGSIHQIHPSH